MNYLDPGLRDRMREQVRVHAVADVRYGGMSVAAAAREWHVHVDDLQRRVDADREQRRLQ